MQCQICERKALFKFKQDRQESLCRKHKLEGMIRARTSVRLCSHVGCTQAPCFGMETAKYCGKHRIEHMRRVHHGCQFPKCLRYARFSFHGKPDFCSVHKQPAMRNTKDVMCEMVGCTIQASFGHAVDGVRKFCTKHRSTDTICLKTRCCEKCTKRPRYGSPGSHATHCSSHRQEGQISDPKRTCGQCKEPALYGITRPEYCRRHATDVHVNLIQKSCLICSVLETVDSEGKCTNCSTYLRAKLHLRKQRIVKNWMDGDDTLRHIELYDSQVSNGSCGKERPDFVWDAQTHKVVLEVDEHQHDDRDPSCEVVRMKNLTYALGMPIYWIRYNPDGMTSIREHARKHWLLSTLKDAMRSAPKTPQEFCRLVYMFYDNTVISSERTIHIL